MAEPTSYTDAEAAALAALDDYEYGPSGRPLMSHGLGGPRPDLVTIVRVVLASVGIVPAPELSVVRDSRAAGAST